MACLIDSSVWIAAANPKNKECLQLKRMISQNESIFVTTVIQVEVAQGAKSETQFHDLWNAFLGFDHLEITDKHWGQAAYHYFKCRKAGMTIGTIDCLIATLSHDYQIPLWTLDATLKKARSVIGFTLKTARG